MSQLLDTRRLNLLKTSIEQSGLCKTLVTMASDLTAAEWAHALTEPQTYGGTVHPLLLNVYNEETIETIISEGHMEKDELLSNLFQLWFDAVCNGTEIENTRSATELSATPVLRPIFNGHLLKMFAMSTVGAQCEDFVRPRIKKLASELLAIANTEGEDVTEYIFGTRGQVSIYPHLSDYEQSEKEFALSFLFFLNALTQALELLDINKPLTEEREIHLNNGDIAAVLDTSDLCSLSKLRNERQYAKAEAYIASEYPKFEELMSNYVLDASEKVYIRSLYMRGILVYTPKEATETAPEPVQDVEEQESIELPVEHLEPRMPSLSVAASHADPKSNIDFLSGLKAGLSNIKEKFGTEPVEIQEPAPEMSPDMRLDHEDNSDADDINDMILSHKKKGKGFSLFCIIAFCISILFLILTLKVSSDEPNSVIEQSTNQTNNKFKVVHIE